METQHIITSCSAPYSPRKQPHGLHRILQDYTARICSLEIQNKRLSQSLAVKAQNIESIGKGVLSDQHLTLLQENKALRELNMQQEKLIGALEMALQSHFKALNVNSIDLKASDSPSITLVNKAKPNFTNISLTKREPQSTLKQYQTAIRNLNQRIISLQAQLESQQELIEKISQSSRSHQQLVKSLKLKKQEKKQKEFVPKLYY